MFSAEVSEIMNGKKKRKEMKVSTFSFAPSSKDEAKHDIDFSRVRYAEQGKWIFTVTNNKDEEQKVTVGLITQSANKNPIGMDIYHNDDFSAELKANTLAILEKNYIAPVLTQTLVNAQFEQPDIQKDSFQFLERIIRSFKCILSLILYKNSQKQFPKKQNLILH